MELLSLPALLVLGTSLSWAGLDALRKRLTEDISPLAVVLWLTVGQVPVLGAWALAEGRPLPLDGVYAAVALGSVALNLVANVAFVAALRVSALSLTVPLLSLTPVGVALVAIPLLGEVPGPLQAAGIVLVVVGALLLGADTSGARSPLAWARALGGDRGSALMLLVAVCWSLTLPLDKLGVERAGAALHALVLSTGVAVATLAAMLARRERVAAVPRRALPALAAAVVLAALALGLQLLAIRVVLVGVVEAVKRVIGNLAALLVGGAVFGERPGPLRALALALMAAGAAAVLLG